LSELGHTGLVEQRRLLLFATALFVPVLVLTGLAVSAIQNDRRSFAWLQAQGQRRLIEELSASLDRRVEQQSSKVFTRIGATLAMLDQPEELFELLDRLTASDAGIRGFFYADAQLRLLYPKPARPYRRADRPEPAQDSADAVERLQRRAHRSQVEANVAALRRDPEQDGALRAQTLRTLATDELPSSETWSILKYAEARERSQLGQIEQAEALYRGVEEARVPCVLHDGRAPRVESALVLANRAKAPEVAYTKLLQDLFAGRYEELDQGRFKAYATAAFEGLRKAPLSPAARELDRQLRARLSRLEWIEDLEGDLRAELDTMSTDPSPHGGLTRQLTRFGESPRLLSYRAFPSEDGSSHRFIGFQTKLDALLEGTIAPSLEEAELGSGLSLAVVAANGLRILQRGSIDDRRPAISVTPRTLPFWQLTVWRDPNAIAQSSSRRSLILFGLIAVALLGVGLGAFSTFRHVQQSLELARMKSDFLSNITHELKTPLTSIQMFAEMLSLGRVRNQQKRLEYYQHITNETTRLRTMIDDILDFARSEQGKVHYVLASHDLEEVMHDAADLFHLSAEARGFSLDLQTAEAGPLPPVNISREAIVRLLLNLLSNAVKYSLLEHSIVMRLERRGDVQAISIRDRGIGIEPENLKRIFDKFFREGDPLTREVSGTGLGLSLVDSIARAHGGRLEVESRKSEGSTFTLLLPSQSFAQHSNPEGAATAPPVDTNDAQAAAHTAEPRRA
jgi:signal transduction histidine kinase